MGKKNRTSVEEGSSKSLLEFLSEVPDFRRGQGRRYELSKVLAMLIMAIMSGRYGIREIGRFIRSNAELLSKHLSIDREQLPSHVTVRAILQGVDIEAVIAAFERWMGSSFPGTALEGAVIALDGKSLGSTLRQSQSSYQDFVCMVSAFAHSHQQVLGMSIYHNKEASEVVVSEELLLRLIESLGLNNAVVTMDALYCQKNVAEDSQER